MAQEEHLSETLGTSSSDGCSDLSPPSLVSDPSLSKSLSFSRLNAKAPEFVPITRAAASAAVATNRPDLQQQQPPQQQRPRIVIPQGPPPPPPPGVVHVYPSPPFVPIQGQVTHVPVVQNHHNHHHNHHHPPHQQQQQQQHQQRRNHQHHQHHHHVQYHPVHQQQPHQYYGGGGGGGGGFTGEQEAVAQAQQAQVEPSDHVVSSRNGLSEESNQKILNQVEYYFSDLNLATTDHLMRFINKDPEGYVPLCVVLSFKKIKALVSSNSQLATILRNSAKLVVSEDGKKVRRQHPLTESDMEELQTRIVVAENLPEDHCHQNLMKVFSAVGSVKTIRTCQPQPTNAGASSATRSAKVDGLPFSNKLHAFVEYESVELAEKAVTELNNVGNWRSSLKVRLLLRRASKPAHTRGKKGHETEGNCEEEDTSTSDLLSNEKQSENPSQQRDTQSHDHTVEEHVNDKEGGQRKGRNRGRGKGRGRGQHHNNNRGSHVGTPPINNMINIEQPIAFKQPPGPRMPDGTRGFAMGRGKPLALNVA